MRSTFFGLEVARSAMQANQVALDVVNHNIANAKNKAYSRQQATMAVNSPFMMPGMNKPTNPGQIGTGVHIEQIRRLRDQFADIQYRKENKFLGESEAKQRALEQMELVYNEPSDSAIRGNIDEFWQSLQDLSVKPELEPVRTTVRQKALQLTESLNHAYSQLDELRKDNDSEIETTVIEVNSLARQLRDLNNEIIRVEVGGDKANDYRDRRDQLLDDLSKLVGIQTEEDNFGAVNVYINGKALVSNTTCNEFAITTKKVDADHDFREVRWADTNDLVNITGGTLKGLQEVRDEIIPQSIAKLDETANTIANHINTIHAQGLGLDGQTGMDFFAANATAHVLDTTSYIFKGDTNDFTGTCTFTLNGQNVTFAAGANNKETLTNLQNALEGAGVTGLSVKLIEDKINNQFRLEMHSTKPISFDTLNAPATANSAATLKQLGFTSTDKAASNIAAKPQITAKNITLSDEIKNSLRNIAAGTKPTGWTLGTKPAPADGTNAMALANIKQTKLLIGSRDGAPVTTVTDFFNSAMSELGVWSQEALNTKDNKEILLQGLDMRRQSVCGVNKDDEMADMIVYQHGLSAAARMISTLNDIFDTIINRMGV